MDEDEDEDDDEGMSLYQDRYAHGKLDMLFFAKQSTMYIHGAEKKNRLL
jgi:hypothetical protein